MSSSIADTPNCEEEVANVASFAEMSRSATGWYWVAGTLGLNVNARLSLMWVTVVPVVSGVDAAVAQNLLYRPGMNDMVTEVLVIVSTFSAVTATWAFDPWKANPLVPAETFIL
jgi:hypothetical protein